MSTGVRCQRKESPTFKRFPSQFKLTVGHSLSQPQILLVVPLSVILRETRQQ